MNCLLCEEIGRRAQLKVNMSGDTWWQIVGPGESPNGAQQLAEMNRGVSVAYAHVLMNHPSVHESLIGYKSVMGYMDVGLWRRR